jgi:T5SS/PEP-CTERM-associated repeat protein
VVSQAGLIGVNTTSSNNIVTVTGSNSAWANTLDILVGNNGSSNSLVITNGGSVINQYGYIGRFSSNNSVLVTGTNSTWTNSINLIIGLQGSSNSLIISDGGSVVNAYGYIGIASTSSNSSASIMTWDGDHETDCEIRAIAGLDLQQAL